MGKLRSREASGVSDWCKTWFKWGEERAKKIACTGLVRALLVQCVPRPASTRSLVAQVESISPERSRCSVFDEWLHLLGRRSSGTRRLTDRTLNSQGSGARSPRVFLLLLFSFSSLSGVPGVQGWSGSGLLVLPAVETG